MPLIDARGISKHYMMGDVRVEALVDASLKVDAGEALAIVGPSGSGKSTLMHLLGCLDQASGGFYSLDGEDVGSLSRARLAALRCRSIGFVFQGFNLLARSTALENVELPLIYGGCGRQHRRRRALDLLEMVGLADRAHHLPSQLSGGQQQRVAIARALANDPQLLLADEPTGSLDSQASSSVLRILRDVNAQGPTVMLITHDQGLAQAMRRVVTLRDGKIISDRSIEAEQNRSKENGAGGRA